jgi:hypothetical protein
MRRRTLISLALCPPLSLTFAGLTWAATADASLPPDDEPQPLPHYTVSAEVLQQAVAQRFPLRYPVPGLMNLDMQVPRLSLLPAQNRLGAEMPLVAAGPALQGSHQGTLAVDFALRYEASDLTVRAHQLRFKRLTMPSLQSAVVALLNTYGPALSESALLEVVVHRLQPSDLALPNSLGMQPGSITVTDTGLLIGFVPKPLSQQ